MASGLDLIKRSMRLIRVLGVGETPTDAESQDALAALNTMLESWSIERLAVYQILDETFTWAASQASHTMGSGGNFATTRPVKVSGFYSRINDQDYQATIIEKDVYDAFGDKTVSGDYPDLVFAEMSVPLVTLYAYPVPDAALSVHVKSWKQLQSFALLTTDLALPPGYREAIEYNLGLRLAPEFGRAAVEAARDIKADAETFKARLKSLNAPSLIAQTELAYVVGSRRRGSNIIEGP